jgi:hypothetical protein
MDKASSLCCAVIFACAMAGCSKAPDQNAASAFNEAGFNKLASRVSALESKSRQAESDRVAYLKPSEQSFQRLKTDIGMMALSISNVSEYATGSKLILNIGNPTTASLQGVTAKFEWGRVDQNGAPVGQTYSQDVSFTEDLPAGAWRRLEINLSDVPPKELAYVRVKDLGFKSISLNSAR